MTFGIIELYEIQYGEYNITSGQLMDGTTNITLVNTTDNKTFSMTFFNLQEGREYGFQVRAYTVGPGPFANIVTNTTLTSRKTKNISTFWNKIFLCTIYYIYMYNYIFILI